MDYFFKFYDLYCKYNPLYIEDFKIFLCCPNCKSVPTIKFINTKRAFVSCKCNKNKLLNFKEIHDKFFLDYIEHKRDIIENYSCQKHDKKEFEYYCENCELNLCKDCLKNHKCDIKYLKDLKIYRNKESEIYYFLDILDESFNSFKEVISDIIYIYNRFPQFKLRQNISNILNLCKEEKNKSLSFAIHLTNKLLFDTSFLKEKNLNNLKELCLKNNKLNNEQIPILIKLNCKDLEILDLESNSFTSYLLLTVNENFTKLKILNLSSNRLYEDYNILKDKKISYHSIAKLNLSNGIFSDKTINLLSCLILSNLEHLDISSNNLSSLIFIRKINFGDKENKIRKLIASNNNYFSIDIINEYIDYLKLNYVHLEALILEQLYPTEYKEKSNLRFKIICFDEGQKTSCLIEEYEKTENESENRLNTLLDYQKRYDNDDNEEE